MITPFEDRHDAGRFLARKLARYADREDTIVLALPRGGVPVGYEVALALHLPLDIFVVRKLGAPFYEELAIGAIASGGVRVLNDSLVGRLGVTQPMLEAVTAEEQRELERREQTYRKGRPPLELSGKTVILVDDGLATGASMRAAVQALRQRYPQRIVVAVPVGAQETCREFKAEVDEIVCGKTPEELGAVGMWYRDFTQTTDEEVAELLRHLAHERRVQKVLEAKPELYHDVLTHDG